MILAVSSPSSSPSDAPDRRARAPRWFSPGHLALLAIAVAAASAIVYSALSSSLTAHGAVTLLVFLTAVWMWLATPIDDTYVALAAASVLVVTGALAGSKFTATLGEEFIWLLIGAFAIAAAVTATGLPARIASRLVASARTPRQLVHLLTAALILTAFAVPSTAGRAALALPIFLGLATVLSDRRRLVRCLAILTPTVILLSAIASPLGAGAHLLTNQILNDAVGESFTFFEWVLVGLPLALVWSHLAAEIVLRLFTRPEDRRTPLTVPASLSACGESTDAAGSRKNGTVLVVLVVAIAAWCTEPIHNVGPAIVAVTAALIITAPRFGTTSLSAALKTVEWPLLIFMAATLAMAQALTASGAAKWLADGVFSLRHLLGEWITPGFLVVLIIVSVGAHLLIQSRSARTAALIPIVVAIAPTAGLNPVAAAFISTAAAGFCLTMTSSAKPLALFASPGDVPSYTGGDLLRVSAVLAPISAGLVGIFTLTVWPALGLPLYL